MTAFLSLPFGDRIELLTDGATCLPDGRLLRRTDKISWSPFCPLAVTGRGAHRDLRQLTTAVLQLAACGSVDATLRALGDGLEVLRSEAGEPPETHFELVLACYSETNGPCHYQIRSYELDGQPAWTLLDFTGQVMGGGPSFDAADMIESTGLTAADFAEGAAAAGLKMMEYLRAIPGRDETRADSVTGYWIGGHVDHAVVSADGVQVQRLRIWPDAPFELINPLPLPSRISGYRVRDVLRRPQAFEQ